MPATATARLINPQPLAEAIESLDRRTPLGSRMRTAEWERMPLEIRRQTFWSAGVTHQRWLEEARARILQRTRMERTRLADGGAGATMDRARFVAEMRQMADEAGIRPLDPADGRGSLTDPGSERRLNLIWRTQVEMAQGESRRRMDMDPDLLRATPAQELIRVSARAEPRDWQQRWIDAGGQLIDGGRMIALKWDPIWSAISRFGQPYPPFDFNSGMGLRNVRRREAVALGLMQPGERPPADAGRDPAGREAAPPETSIRGLSPAGREAIVESLGDELEIDGDVVRLRPLPADAPRRVARPRWTPAPVETQTHPADSWNITPVTRSDGGRVSVIRSLAERIGIQPPNGNVRITTPATRDNLAFEPASQPGTVAVAFLPDDRPRPDLDAAQIIGMAMDNFGLHTATAARPYASQGEPRMAAVIEELYRTAAAMRLAEYGRADALAAPSIFSRAFAQWAAARSTAFAPRSAESNTGLWWTAADFHRTRKAIDRLFSELGWLRTRPAS